MSIRRDSNMDGEADHRGAAIALRRYNKAFG
jgi:hypothetical protein